MKKVLRPCALALLSLFGVASAAAAQEPPPPAEPPAVEQPPPEQPPPPTQPPPVLPPPVTPPPAPAPSAATGPLKIEGPNASIRFGVLLQPQYEAAGSLTQSGYAHNLYLRRARVLVGGTLFQDFEFFFESDSPNLFKANVDGVKNTQGMFVQDAIVTWKRFEFLKIDAGFMFPPLAHNAVQSAATLYSWDYFTNTFRHSDIFNAASPPVGRDAGAQLRGLVLGGRLEYRFGAFQGLREPSAPAMGPTPAQTQAQNMVRLCGRLQFNLWDPETAFFYAGSYLGKKRILSVGAAFDVQDDYHYWAGDVFFDYPLGPDVVTAQFNVAQWNSDGFIRNAMGAPVLPTQTAYMIEAGYLIGKVELSPIGRFERLAYSAPGTDSSRLSLGLAWWYHGHNSNLKFFYSFIRNETDAAPSTNQVNLQWQYYIF
ncbi:MAG TPA: hypothetical protein VKN99_07110 [Polyangia bacterium]|nr:hypothetical protein [Polyangia bacterium]